MNGLAAGGLTPGPYSDRAPCGCARLLSVAQVRAVKATERSPQRKGAAPGAGARRSARNREIGTPTVRGLGRHSHVDRGFSSGAICYYRFAGEVTFSNEKYVMIVNDEDPERRRSAKQSNQTCGLHPERQGQVIYRNASFRFNFVGTLLHPD